MATAELEFVASMRDDASAAARSLRSVMDGVGGPVDPIEAAINLVASNIAATLAQVEQVTQQVVQAADAAGGQAGQQLGAELAAGVSASQGEVVAEGAQAGQAAGAAVADGAEDGVEGLNLAPAFAAAGAAAGAALIGATLSAMDNEKVLDRLSAQLALTGPESETAGKVAGSLYAGAYGENLGDVSVAVGAVMSSIDGMRGATEADLQGLTGNALDFADAFEVDVVRATQVAGQLMRTGLAADGQEAFDLLTTASQQVPAAVREDVIDAADEYGQFFATLGYNGREAFALIVDAADKGTFGVDKIGDAVKEFTILSTDMSTSSVAAYDSLGLSAEDYAGRILAGGDSARTATGEIVAALQGVEDPAAQAQAAIALFGTPLEDLNATEIPAFLDALGGAGGELENVAGATDQLGATLADNASTNLESFRRQVTTAFVDTVGGKVLPVVSEWASTLATQVGPALSGMGAVLGSVVGWMREHEGIVKAVAIALAALVVVTQLHAAVLAVSAAGGLVAYIAQMGIVQAATKTWAAVQWVLNAAMSANPIALVVIAIAALVAGVLWAWHNVDGFKEGVIAAWEWIKSATMSVFNAVKSFLISTWQTVSTSVLAVAIGLRNAVTGAWDWIKSKVLGAMLLVRNTVLGAWNAIGERVRFAVALVRTLIAAGFDAAKAKVVAVMSGIVTTITGVQGRVRAAAQAVVDGITGVFRGVVETVTGIGRNIVDGIVSGIRGAIGRVTSAARAIADAVPGPVRSLLGINSPSRVMALIGTQTGQGLELGLLGMTGDVAAASARLANAATAPVVAADLGALSIGGGGVTVGGSSTVDERVILEHRVSFDQAEVASKLSAADVANLLQRDPVSTDRIERILAGRAARRPIVSATR